MLDYLYRLTYSVEPSCTPFDEGQQSTSDNSNCNNNADTNHALIHAHMYKMGDKYLIPDLKEYARRCFEDAISVQSGSQFAESVTAAYTTNPESDRGLRDAILTNITKSEMRARELQENAEFSRVVSSIPCFGYELWGWTVRKRLLTDSITTEQETSLATCILGLGGSGMFSGHGEGPSIEIYFNISAPLEDGREVSKDGSVTISTTVWPTIGRPDHLYVTYLLFDKSAAHMLDLSAPMLGNRHSASLIFS
ncbi:hypothetical protein VTN00DRAFT_5662 [Thermoascus crustaceus]|uniref:uncharacterized protein n=1 Tax=Thermoascus crustaceus TaxID=5088 RepID=UPI003743CF1F